MGRQRQAGCDLERGEDNSRLCMLFLHAGEAN